MKQFFKDIRTGIYNFWFFRKVIWDFRWWDYTFNLELFSKSLEYSAIETAKKGNHEGSLENSLNMWKVVDLIEQVKTDVFIDESERQIGYKLKGFDLEPIEGTDSFRLVDQEGTDKEKSRQVCELSQKLEKENWELIWKKLNDEMQNWWD